MNFKRTNPIVCTLKNERKIRCPIVRAYLRLSLPHPPSPPHRPHIFSSSLYRREQHRPDKEDEVTSSEEINLPYSNSGREAVPRSPEVDMSRMFSESTHESAAKLLQLCVRWARSIPSFQQLCARDQIILLEEAWSSLFVLSAAQWFLPVDEGSLVLGCVAPPTRHAHLEEDARKLKDIITKFSSIRVDHTEYACLKALVLFKSEKRGLRDAFHVELLQDQTHVMLHEYCSIQHKARFGKLLLSLLLVSSISRQSLQELFFKKTIGNVPLDRLLKDIHIQTIV